MSDAAGGRGWPRVLLFDLDGTLVDTVPDIAWCVNRTLADLGHPARDERAVRAWVGNGVGRLMERALSGRLDGDAGRATVERAVAVFLRYYRDHDCERSRPYPDAAEVLASQRRHGRRLGCVTNKPQRPAEQVLEHFGLARHLDLVLGGDRVAHIKPDPAPLCDALRELGGEPADAALVGDSRNDVEAARAAGIAVVCVSYGYNHGEDIASHRPDAVIDALRELPDALRRCAQARGLPATANG